MSPFSRFYPEEVTEVMYVTDVMYVIYVIYVIYVMYVGGICELK